jgi:outer membrane immunogenic protein
MRGYLLSAGIVLASAVTAQAADLPTTKPAPSYLTPIPAFSWSGFYVGANGGWAGGSFGGSDAKAPPSVNGGMLGGTVGYNYQMGHYVIGYEGDLDYVPDSWLDGTKTVKTTTEKITLTRGFLTERARLGYAIDRTLLFVTGGYAGADIHGIETTPKTSFSNGGWTNGYTVGAGAEYAFTNNISIKAEYLFAGFDSKPYFKAPVATKGGLDLSLVRVGLNYHF